MDRGVEVADRFPCFDGYRALAAGTVLVTHVSFITIANHYGVFGPYFARFDIGVSFFFLISGFLLYRPFAAAVLASRPRPSLRRYMRRRALRILPAYWLALTVALFVFHSASQRRPGDLVFFYGFAQIYDAHHAVGGIPAAWSLDVEMTFYLFIPLWAALTAAVTSRARSDPLRVQLVGCGILYAVSLAWRLWVLSPGFGFRLGPFGVAPGNAYDWLPGRLDMFALGMALATVSAWCAGGGRLSERLDRLAARPWPWWVGGATAFWVVARHTGLPLDMRPYGEAVTFAWQALYGLVAFLILVPGIFGDQRQGWSRRVLQTRWVVWLGAVSYGIYLWHELFIGRLQQWLGWAPFTGHFDPMLIGVGVLTVASASASYVLVERPILRHKQPRARTPPPPVLRPA